MSLTSPLPTSKICAPELAKRSHKSLNIHRNLKKSLYKRAAKTTEGRSADAYHMNAVAFIILNTFPSIYRSKTIHVD